jgi:hypothetical protein
VVQAAFAAGRLQACNVVSLGTDKKEYMLVCTGRLRSAANSCLVSGSRTSKLAVQRYLLFATGVRAPDAGSHLQSRHNLTSLLLDGEH